MHASRRCSCFLTLAITGVFIAFPNTGRAQLVTPKGAATEITNIFLPAPRGLRQLLSRARKALDQQDYGQAVDLLGRLLADPQLDSQNNEGVLEQDYFVGGPTSQEATRTSLKAAAQRLLGSMPAKGRELYELKFGADARRMLDQAVKRGNLQQLTEVARRYFHTAAGYEATMLLGRYDLDQGRPLAAALCFQRLADTPYAAARYAPELSVLQAACWLFAGQPDQARSTLVALKTRSPKATLRVGDKELALFSQNDDPIAWLKQLIGQGFALSRLSATQWTLYRGDATRNAESDADFPLLMARWHVPTANHPNDESMIESRKEMFTQQVVPAMPALHPLAIDDVILMRTPRRLIAVDFKTGKRVWDFPWFETPEEQSMFTDQVRAAKTQASSRADELAQRMWNDAAYGQMSSDGRRVFFLWQLGFVNASTQRQQAIIRAMGRVGPKSGIPNRYNKLVALDLQQQGKLQWMVGGEDGTDEPHLAGTFFLGAPLPLMDRLYVLAERNGEIRLVVLDADNGRLLWSQQLAHVGMRDILGDVQRRLAGASPSFSNGILVCPTSAGAVVAVDVSTRSLLWGFQYPQAGVPTRRMFGAFRMTNKPIGDRWNDATVTIANGRVLVTPVESDQLFCLDLLSGKPVWKERPRDGMLYLACVHQDSAVLVGKDRVEAVSIADGKTVWKLDLTGAMPSGRGMMTGDSYFLGTTANELLQIDLAHGKIKRRSRTDEPLGNLVAYHDQIISQSVEDLAAYYQTEPLRSIVADRLKKSPDDSWALARHAQLLHYDGKMQQAVATLQRANKLSPDDDEIRQLLVKISIEAMETDFAANHPLAATIEPMLPDYPEKRLRFYQTMASGYQQIGQPDQAIKFFILLASTEPAQSVSSDRPQEKLINVSPTRKLHRDRWLRLKLAEMFDAADPTQRTKINQRVQDYLKQVLADKSPNRLARFVRQFGGYTAVQPAQLQLAQQYITRQEWLRAEQVLITLQESSEPKIAAGATAMMAAMLKQAGHPLEAAQCYQQLRTRWPDQEAAAGQTGIQLAEQAAADPAIRQAMEPAATWPAGKCESALEDPRTRGMPIPQRVFPIRLADVNGPFPQQATLAYDYSRNTVVLRDRFGATTQRLALNSRNRFYTSSYALAAGAARGHLLVTNVGFEVLGINLLKPNTTAAATGTAEILWRGDLSNTLGITAQRHLMATTIYRQWGPARYVAVDRSRRMMGTFGPITRDGVVYQERENLVCVDPMNGDVMWKRSGITAGSDIFGDDQLLFVVSPTANEAMVLRPSDAKELGSRDVASRADRWITRGRNVLACTMANDKLQIRWFDAWDKHDKWQRTFAVTSQCWQVDHDHIAVMEQSGKLVVIQIDTGKNVLDVTLKPEPRLARLYVLPSRDGYIVVASDQKERSVSSTVMGVRVFGVSIPDYCPLINGRVYAIGRDGKMKWPEPAIVRQFSLPLDQPIEVPAIVFLRHVSQRKTKKSTRSTTTASVLCVAKRDGRQLLYQKDLPMIQYYAIKANPTDHTQTVATNSRNIRLTFTDQPAGEAKPIQVEDPTAALNALKQVGKIAASIVDAFAKKNRKDAEAKKAAVQKKDPKPVRNPLQPAAKPEAKPDPKSSAERHGKKDDAKPAAKIDTKGDAKKPDVKSDAKRNTKGDAGIR